MPHRPTDHFESDPSSSALFWIFVEGSGCWLAGLELLHLEAMILDNGLLVNGTFFNLSAVVCSNPVEVMLALLGVCV
jgi:hypothetical protein